MLTNRGNGIAALLLSVFWATVPPNAALPQSGDGDEILEVSPIDDLIIDYVATRPDATLEEVAAFANARLPEYGLNHDFYKTEVPPDRTVVLQAGTRRLLRTTPADIDTGGCGQYWVTLPAVRSSDESIDIIHRGERLTVPRPADLYIEWVTIYDADQKRMLNRFDVFGYLSSPLGVLPDGRGLILSFPLDDEASPWWQRVRATHPHILESNAHLRVQIDADGVEFVGDPSGYADQPSEEIDDFDKRGLSDVFRTRFFDTGLVIEYSPPCA